MKLTITKLGKQYCRDFWGLQEFSLDVKPGILGLLGPNGAGKSTFMRMLATITKPTEGTILWDDVDITWPIKSWDMNLSGCLLRWWKCRSRPPTPPSGGDRQSGWLI